MFPQVFPPPPPPPPAPATRPVVPAKREDDDVQFVSSNPVKKRRLDTHRPIMPPPTIPTITHSPPPADNQPVPAPNHQPPEPPKHAAVTAVPSQPERRGSTGMVDPSSTSHAMDIDPTRGCSVPIPERSQYLESFWTAPSSGPQCSPPVSPKTLPEHVQPSMLRLDEHHGPAPGPTNGLSGGGGAVDTRTVDSILAGAVDFIPEPDAASMSDATNGQQQVTTGTVTTTHNQPCAQADLKSVSTVPMLDFQRGQSPAKTPNTTATPQVQPHIHTHAHHHTPHPSPVASLAQIPAHTPAHASAHGTTQAGSCGDRPAPGAKGPCRQCLEARLRQQAASQAAQAANLTAAAAMPSTANVPGAAQTSMSSSTIQQHWPHMLGINPYANPMAGAMYGPLLQQSMMAGPNSAFALPQQQYPHGMPAQQSAGHMLPMAPTSTQPVAPTYSSSQRNPYLQTPSSAKPAKPAAPKATDPPQLTTKHIIVDIADTCLNVFPFEEVAKRHNQPEQKVRDIFGAVIQVPLLRCNTDKRRAGKLGTARVKEFNQAKKDAQAQVSSNQSKQDAMAQGPYMPSAWEMAQFMGPSDVRLGMFNNQFTGPW
ncbi:hypothetical protein CCHR01_05968 [Colletotrichum chrysophilum]|uniref:Uncharacterized protein n=1 Tax=Colletotrichum chrysophilum TaxID=1836956 RepID=A0AAD9AQJ6_9PEZI|nr:hypothetical protein CCHR01_05968 [Colletotrichum chrysophilum]